MAGYSQNVGPLQGLGLRVDHIAAPNIDWCRSGTLILGTTHVFDEACSQSTAAARNKSTISCAVFHEIQSGSFSKPAVYDVGFRV